MCVVCLRVCSFMCAYSMSYLILYLPALSYVCPGPNNIALFSLTLSCHGGRVDGGLR